MKTMQGLDNIAFSYCIPVCIAFVEGFGPKLLNIKLATQDFLWNVLFLRPERY
jgi:hypothetical protein